ncbi:MAG: hypothetical protein WCF84_03340 [Anaerolineae bacterium]
MLLGNRQADHIFWFDALNATPASQVGVFLYIESLIMLVVASAMSAIGGVIIILGVWLVNRSPRPAAERTRVEAQVEEPS